VRYLGTEVDKAIEVTEQIGADDFAPIWSCRRSLL